MRIFKQPNNNLLKPLFELDVTSYCEPVQKLKPEHQVNRKKTSINPYSTSKCKPISNYFKTVIGNP